MSRLFIIALSSLALIEPAIAQSGAQQQAPNPLFMFLLVMIVMWFFMIRPQMKRHKEMQQMVNSLQKGDKIITTGGIAGIVKKVDEAAELLEVQIAEGVVVQILRSTVANKIDKDSPLNNKIGKTKTSDAKSSNKKSTNKKSTKTKESASNTKAEK